MNVIIEVKCCFCVECLVAMQAYVMVHRALCHMMVLPWPDTPDMLQEWDARSAELAKLVSGTTRIFAHLKQIPGWEHNAQLQQQGIISLSLFIFFMLCFFFLKSWNCSQS